MSNQFKWLSDMKSLLVFLVSFGVGYGLQCGTTGLPVSQDMGRLYRTCMHQSTEQNYHQRQGGNSNNNNNNHNSRRIDYEDNNDDLYYRPRSGNRNNGGGGGRFRRQSDYNNYQSSSSTSSSQSQTQSRSGDCLAHCLFKELNMLNNEDYPDKHKMYYVLTRSVRNTEIREFFSDSIHECFQMMDQEKRRDNSCDYSKKLLNCMVQYAKANCDDWDDHSLLFT